VDIGGNFLVVAIVDSLWLSVALAASVRSGSTAAFSVPEEAAVLRRLGVVLVVPVGDHDGHTQPHVPWCAHI
jgi:hypothetical protein